MKKILNEENQINNFILCVWENFVVPFYYGSGTVINYGSGSGSDIFDKLRFRFHTAKIYGSNGSDSDSGSGSSSTTLSTSLRLNSMLPKPVYLSA